MVPYSAHSHERCDRAWRDVGVLRGASRARHRGLQAPGRHRAQGTTTVTVFFFNRKSFFPPTLKPGSMASPPFHALPRRHTACQYCVVDSRDQERAFLSPPTFRFFAMAQPQPADGDAAADVAPVHWAAPPGAAGASAGAAAGAGADVVPSPRCRRRTSACAPGSWRRKRSRHMCQRGRRCLRTRPGARAVSPRRLTLSRG